MVSKIVGVALLAAATISCASASGQPAPLPVPTFAGPAAPPPGAAVPADSGLPDDCERLLAVDDLGALLGLPLDSVAVRTTIGVPAPSVGRTERLACRYTGAAGGPQRGATLLDLNAALYTDAEAAEKQWRVNADAEDGERSEMSLGSAPAMLVERRAEAMLTVVHGPGTLTVILPARVRLPGDRTRAEALEDLTLRVLPALTPPPPAESAAS
jgi:hypothetical protein